MTNKEAYEEICNEYYIPIYSKPWWMDAVCGKENWNVELLEVDGNVLGTLVYYVKLKGTYKYITKAPLTQTNGIIFLYPTSIKEINIPQFQEKVINIACEYIKSLKIDVYEQQYAPSFYNWSPFFWNHYQAIPRYTYYFTKEQLADLDSVWNKMDKKKRRGILRGESNCTISVNDLSPHDFYCEVEKVYNKQGLSVPYSYELWESLYYAVMKKNAGQIISARNEKGIVYSTKFVVWDEKNMYALISGGGPEYQLFETKSAIDWFAIKEAARRGLNYDFEGSMIERIAKVYRSFGATPRMYFRIRKVFNKEIISIEAKDMITQLEQEMEK